MACAHYPLLPLLLLLLLLVLVLLLLVMVMPPFLQEGVSLLVVRHSDQRMPQGPVHAVALHEARARPLNLQQRLWKHQGCEQASWVQVGLCIPGPGAC